MFQLECIYFFIISDSITHLRAFPSLVQSLSFVCVYHKSEGFTDSPEEPCGEVDTDELLRFLCWFRGLQRLTSIRNT